MRVAIVGAGAMGSLLAGLLQVSPFLGANDEIWLVGADSTKDASGSDCYRWVAL